jgi:hypothetical protein
MRLLTVGIGAVRTPAAAGRDGITTRGIAAPYPTPIARWQIAMVHVRAACVRRNGRPTSATSGPRVPVSPGSQATSAEIDLEHARASCPRILEADKESAQVPAQASFRQTWELTGPPMLAPLGRAGAKGPRRLARQAGSRRVVNGVDGVERARCRRIAEARLQEAAPGRCNNSATVEATAWAVEDTAGAVAVSAAAAVAVEAEEADGGGNAIRKQLTATENEPLCDTNH